MFTNLPPVTKVLLIINGLVFLLELVLGQRVGLLSPFMLWPLQPGAYDALSGTAFMPWQLITYGFLDRQSGVSGKSVSVRVGLGGRRVIKKKNTTKINRT